MDQKQIGTFIAQLRHEAGWTQETLGQKIGVTNKTISRWENGNYMPDIEMLKLLSDLFHVSINELLSGRRLDGDPFRRQADQNLVAAVRDARFSRREQESFWKRKWLRDHVALLLCFAALYPALLAGLWRLSPTHWMAGVCPLGLALYLLLRHRMMVYVEHKLYD